MRPQAPNFPPPPFEERKRALLRVTAPFDSPCPRVTASVASLPDAEPYFIASVTAVVVAPSGFLVITGSEPPAISVATVRS